MQKVKYPILEFSRGYILQGSRQAAAQLGILKPKVFQVGKVSHLRRYRSTQPVAGKRLNAQLAHTTQLRGYLSG